MVRRLGCLSALLSILFFVAGLAAIGWFGYHAYVHASDSQAVASRTNEVAQAWTSDPAAVASAASGKGGVRPKGLSSQPYQRMGATAVRSYRTSKSTIVLATNPGACNSPTLVAEVVETPVLVQVLVHPESSWLPDVPRLWRQLRDASTPCPAGALPASVTVTLTSPIGRRILVDAVTGGSVARG